MTEPVLEVEHLYKVFGRRPKEAVERLERGADRSELGHDTTAGVIDASFSVEPGEIFVVMGLSGSGKSTLIRMLNGLLGATAGSVRVGGVEIVDADPATLRRVRQEHVSMVFQHFALFPHRTVLENVAFGLEVKGVPREDRERIARETLATVSLSDWADNYPDALSGGMQQRVGIARALCADTDILLMDEAFSALDPLIRREMQEELIDLQQQLGKTIVFITHDLNEAMLLSDRIAVMRDGRIVQIGTPERILTDPASDYVERFVEDVDRARVLTAASVMQPALAILPITGGIAGAAKRMRDLEVGGLFITERGRLIGAVTERAVGRALRHGATDFSTIIDRDIPRIAPDTVLADLFELAIDNSMPIAVVDERDRLLGVVPRVALLSSLTTGTSALDLPAAASAPPPMAGAPDDSATTEGADR